MSPLERIDLARRHAAGHLAETMRTHQVDAVIHLAARKQVAESVARPLWYYDQNVGGLVTVLEACAAAGSNGIVFSSTAAVYGPVGGARHRARPDRPGEPVRRDQARRRMAAARPDASRSAMRAVSLRYFNVAGASRPELADTAESNVVPMVFRALEAGERP